MSDNSGIFVKFPRFEELFCNFHTKL